MSQQTQHKTQGIHNKNLVDTPQLPPTDPTSPYRDWSTTICFYAALHFIHCYLNQNSTYRTKFKNHKDRNEYIRTHTDKKLQSIRKDYKTLYKAARKARYKPLYYNKLTVSDINDYYKLAFKDIPNKLGI